MAKLKEIVPEFMLDNPEDSFMFLMPLKLKPDLEVDLGDSYFKVAVKNLTKNEHFTTLIAPELFFTRFKLNKAYKNGKLDRARNKKSEVEIFALKIDTRLTPEQYDTKLETLLPDESIGQLLGWKYKYLNQAKNMRCCLISTDYIDIIIPHYAIAVYYFYRSSTLREATLRCDLEELYYSCECDPNDASIVVPKYVPEDDAPFIHRFACQADAAAAFDSVGTYLNAYMKWWKNKKPMDEPLEYIPIKAKFPYRGEFRLSYRYTGFEQKDFGKLLRGGNRKIHFVHEIVDDDSPIGFSKFTTFFQGKKIVTDTDDVDNLPTVPVKNPSDTSERLKPEHANRRYRQNSITVNRKKKCSSLAGVEMSTDKITDEEALAKLKILEETLADEDVDQSLTGSSGDGEKKIRKARISSKGIEFAQGIMELMNNFDEFRQYLEYMQSQKEIVDLEEHGPEKMKTVMNGKDGTPNPKCMLHGRERKYITATFRYKGSYVGLLELENSASTSTWVISSKEPFEIEIFERFLELYVEDDKTVNDIKNDNGKDSVIKFRTKNHERISKLEEANIIRWVAGVLGKL